MDWLTSEFYRLYIAPSLPPIVIIIGWFFVSRDNDRRETRKEIRALLNDMSKNLDKLHDQAISYFCDIDNSTQVSEALKSEIQLKQSLERFDSTLQVLGKMESKFRSSSQYFEELVQSITGHPKFESRSPPSTNKLHQVDEAVLQVALARSNLISHLEHTFVDTQVRRFGCPYESDGIRSSS